MTTTADAPVAPLARRLATVMRVHVANPWPTLITPWLVFLAVFGFNYAIWLTVTTAAGGRDQLDPDAFNSNGGSSWIYIYMLVVAIQAMNLTFAFVLGLGVTRRDYYLGTAVYFTGVAVMFSAGMTAFAQIESATNGWGLDARFFAPWVLGDLSWWRLFLVHLLLEAFFLFVGAMAGAMWVRWRVYGLYAFLGGLALLVVAVMVVASRLDAWGAVGRFFTDNSALVVVGWTLPLTLAAASAGFAIMRRATPRG